jgi:hypothetical protein
MKERFSVRVKETPEYAAAVAAEADTWVPACGGHEEPFLHNGKEWLYVFNPATGDHGYLEMGADIVWEDYHGK